MEFADQTELAIKWDDGHWPGFQAELLTGANYIPVCASGLLQGESPLREPSDLARYPLLHDRDHADWKRWQTLYPDVALCVLALIERPLRNGELVIPFPERSMRHPLAYYLLTRRQRPPSALAQQFIEWLKGEAQETEASVNKRVVQDLREA